MDTFVHSRSQHAPQPTACLVLACQAHTTAHSQHHAAPAALSMHSTISRLSASPHSQHGTMASQQHAACAAPLAGVLHAGRDALDGDDERVVHGRHCVQGEGSQSQPARQPGKRTGLHLGAAWGAHILIHTFKNNASVKGEGGPLAPACGPAGWFRAPAHHTAQRIILHSHSPKGAIHPSQRIILHSHSPKGCCVGSFLGSRDRRSRISVSCG